MIDEGQAVDELIVATPGRIAASAPKALTDDVIAISYVAEVRNPNPPYKSPNGLLYPAHSGFIVRGKGLKCISVKLISP